MASDTAPAAVPDPVGQPATDTTTGPATGPVTGLLAPIEPARPTSATFNLDPSAMAPAGTVEQAPAGASSSTYQNDDTTDAKDGKGSSKQQAGVMRAFALAAIERWKKGADARNKRLDIQKAKANAHQTKESRTVNRSEKFAGGSSNSGSASGKSLDSKTKKDSSGSGNGASKRGAQKNSGSKNGSSGSGGASGSGGSAGGRGSSGSSGHGATGKDTSGASPKTSKSDSKTHNGSSHTGTDGKKNSGKNNAGTKTDTATCGDSSGISLAKDKKTKNRDSSSDTRKNGRTDTAGAKDSSKDTRPGKNDKGESNGKSAGKDDSSAKPSHTGDTKTGTDPKKVDLEKKNTKADKTRKTGKGDKPAKDSQPKGSATAPKDSTLAAAKGTPINTQPSREAGYRDGSRTAKATAHVKAYRDGFKDGHHDTSEAAEREKQRLDEAHEARKQQRAKDQPVTASSADHQPQGPQPIDVKEVTDTHVTLDGGKTYTRGEVRNLKQYERRMSEKATNMGKAAEGTRQLEAHAEQQADKALKFLEMAKTVEGGDRFVGVLTRLHEAATIQIREAQELHKRVIRGADNTRVVLVNVETRYGGIYKAVCESPLTKPAELSWYRK